MDHHRCLLRIVLVGIFQLEALRQVIVHLNSTKLPTTANSVLNHEVEFRTIESGLTVFNLGRQSFLLTSLNNSLLGQCPIFVSTNILIVVVRITQRNLSLEIESEGGEHDADDIHNVQELLLNLIWATEQVCIILCERTYTSQSVKLTTLLVTVYSTELCNTQRQIAV